MNRTKTKTEKQMSYKTKQCKRAVQDQKNRRIISSALEECTVQNFVNMNFMRSFIAYTVSSCEVGYSTRHFQ